MRGGPSARVDGNREASDAESRHGVPPETVGAARAPYFISVAGASLTGLRASAAAISFPPAST